MIALFWIGVLTFIGGSIGFISGTTYSLFIALGGLILAGNIFIIRFIQISKKGGM